MFSLLHCNCFDKSWSRLSQSDKGSHPQCTPCSPRNTGRAHLECNQVNEGASKGAEMPYHKALQMEGAGGMGSHPAFATNFRSLGLVADHSGHPLPHCVERELAPITSQVLPAWKFQTTIKVPPPLTPEISTYLLHQVQGIRETSTNNRCPLGRLSLLVTGN